MSKYDIKQNEIYDILASNTGLTPMRVKSLMKYLRELMINELKNTGKIRLEGIGTFSTYDYGGKDFISNLSPTKEKIYIEKTKRLSFKASDIFLDCINDKPVNSKNRKKLKTNKKYQKRFESNHLEEYKTPISDIIDDFLNNKIKKGGNNNE